MAEGTVIELNDVLTWMARATDEEVKQVKKLANQLLKKPNGEVATIKYAARALELACDLAERVQSNYQFVKPSRIDVERWAEEIDKLHRINGYEYELIGAVIMWSQQDDFWKQNVRSGKALRKHFEKLLVKIQHQTKQQQVVEI